MAKAKIKTDLVELARAFLNSDGFKAEVIRTMPVDVVLSFESAMDTVLVSTEGFNTFKAQWIACYRKYARKWAKFELNRNWSLALEAAVRFVLREDETGNDGQNLFDQRYRAQYCALHEKIEKARRVGYGFDSIAVALVEEIGNLITKMDAIKPVVVKTHKVSKPGSASKRGQGKARNFALRPRDRKKGKGKTKK